MVEIPMTDLRRTIEELALREKDIALFDSIGMIPGVVVVEKRDPWQDTWDNFTCAKYVFDIRLREPFASGWKLPQEFQRNPRKFLSAVGYHEVDDVMPGDIIGYASDERALGLIKTVFYRNTLYRFPIFQHWGICVDEGMVESKWRDGYIYRHPLGLIPPLWGNQAYFFRAPTPSIFRFS